MLTSLERMVGLPVVLGTKQVGWVERAVPDLQRRRLRGLIIRRGMGSARWCEDIALIGRESVILTAPPCALPRERWQEPQVVRLQTGQCVGEVTDVLLSGQKLWALEVSPGPFYRLLGRCAYAIDYRVIGQSVIVSRLLSRTQLKTGEEETQWR